MSRHDNPVLLAFAGTISMVAVMGLGRFMYTPVLPAMMTELGMSASDAGILASANYLGYLFGALAAAGGWAAGWEYRFAVAALAANALLLLAMSLTDSLVAHAAIRFLAGVASAYVMVFLSTIVFARLAGLGRSDMEWLYFAGVGAGIALSGFLTALVGAAEGGWRWNWIAGAALAGACAIVAVRLVPAGDSPMGGGNSREPSLPKSSSFYLLTAGYGLFGAGYIVTTTFLVAIVRQDGYAPEFESLVWIATGLAGVPSIWLWGFVVRRIGLTSTFALGCVVETIGVWASVAVPGPAGPIIAGVLVGGTFVAITAFGLQAARRLAGAAPRRALGMMTAAFGTGQVVGPVIAGVVADWTGSFALPSYGAAMTLLLAGAIVWLSGRGRSTL